MTEKKLFSLKNRSFFVSILFAMIVLIFIVGMLVVVNDFYNTKNTFDKNSQHIKRMTEQDITVIIKLTDESYNLYDSSLNEQMRTGFEGVLEAYKQSSGTPALMNLTNLKRNLGEDFDIYLINESGIIEFTTYEPELGMDFKAIPNFFDYLTKIRNSEGFFPDRIVDDQMGSGKARKFAYMPTPDHRYVLELGFSKTTFSGERASIRYKNAIDRIASLNPYIERVRIFNSMGKIADNTSEPVDESTRVLLAQLMQQRQDRTVIHPEVRKSIKYLFIDLKNEQYCSDASRIVELTYDDAMLERAFFEHVQFILLFFILALAVGICAAFLLSRYLTKPISGILKDVNRISDGDLDLKIASTDVTEFQDLEQSINTMVSSLKKAFREVQDEKSFQREVIDQLPVAVFMKDMKDGKYTFWNKASEQIFDIPAGEVIGRTDKELFSTEMVSSITREDSEAFHHHISIFNKKINSKSRGQRIIHMIIVPIFDSTSTFRYILGIAEDFTEETMNMKIDLLFSITRRDILDQLSVIMNYLERAQLKTSQEAMQTFFDKTLESVESIRNQMAFVSSLQAIGITTPTWQSVIKSFWSAVTVLPSRNVDIRVEMDDIELYADPLLPRIFFNLLANSLQHGNHRMTKIRLSARMSEESLSLIYEDNGTGIPELEKGKIFEFGYGKRTGFGLFLARELLGFTGMTITETGEPGKGARFEIVVPKGKFRKALSE
ncbi:MAG: ATP-binding protein [Methanoregula sp.]|nr:ATP-binding protein [Methanoregula sp.]